MEGEVRVPINADDDLVTARAEGRAMAERLGFPRPDPTLIATAISEVARNIIVHVGRGEIVLRPFQEPDRYGLIVIAKDEGPGIRDVEAALRDDYSGRSGLGLGLPGARRLMDDFELDVERDEGTTVTMRKWRFHDRARAPARGAPSSWLNVAARGPLELGVATRSRPRRSHERRSCGRGPSRPRESSIAAIDGLGHGGARRASRPGRPAGWCGNGRAAISSSWPSSATTPCETPEARPSAWPSCLRRKPR